MRYTTGLILALLALFLLLVFLADFIGCYNMLSGSSSWCEPVIGLFGV